MSADRFAPIRRAFTLVELLVVIVIITIGTVLLLPAVSRTIESNNYAAAVNLVTATLGQARAEAIRTGSSTGVVFLFDIETQRSTLRIVELEGQQAGVLTSLPASDFAEIYAQVFRPVTGEPEIELPKGTVVAGLSFLVAPELGQGSRVDSQTAHWYAGERYTNVNNDVAIPWLLPRNDPRQFVSGIDDPVSLSLVDFWSGDGTTMAARHATSFMVRFDGSGQIVALSSGGVASPNAYLEFPDRPLREGFDDPADDPYLFDPEIGLSPPASTIDPNPEVMLRAAQQLAIVDVNRLARDTGIRTPWLVRSGGSLAPAAGNVVRNDEEAGKISGWIDANADVIGFNRYTGNVIRRESP